MFCSNCGRSINELNSNFCSNCGNKLINYDTNINTNVKDDSHIFLILGIIMSFCCCFPAGIAIILINELKYKKLIANGLINEAKTIKIIMIVLIIISILIFIFAIFLNILSFVIETGDTINNYV